jgi:hypothetical protein
VVASPEFARNPTLRAGLVVIVSHAAGDLTSRPQGSEIILDRPNIYDFEKALIAMGLEESDARRYALGTGRSWTVLRRQLSTNLAIRRPGWLDTAPTDSLAVLCMLGSWNASKDADRQVVARLAGRAYEYVEQDLLQLAQLDDAPLLSIGAVWKAKSPLELLNLFGDRITRSQLERFFLIAQEMLSTPDPQLELPDDQRYAAAVYGKVHLYSGRLFKSICDALVKLAVRGSEQPGLQALGIEGRVELLVHNLLDNASASRWLSLASYLPALAEAAPRVFLSEVEKSLKQADAPVTSLLTESRTSGISGRCWHSGLLWALETLAWAPQQLARVALILAQLSHIQIEGNWGNTPGQSLFGLFRSWLPQTAAGLADRIKVLDLLIQKDPDVAFSLMQDLKASDHRHAFPAARPKWRDDDAGAGRGATYAEMHEMHLAARERLLLLSAGKAFRIAALLENSVRAYRGEIFRVLALIEPFTQLTASDEDKETLRRALGKVIHWHRNYDDTLAAQGDEWLLAIEAVYERLAPSDLVSRYCWLFKNHWVSLPRREREDDSQARSNALLQARKDALLEIRQSLGITGIESLIAVCGEPGTVGAVINQIDFGEAQWADWIVEIGSDFTPGLPMTWCISGLLRSVTEGDSGELLQAVMRLGGQRGWDAAKQARFLLLARPEKETWQIAMAAGPEIDAAYWASVRPDYCLRNDDADLSFVLKRLQEARRPQTALQCCRYELERVNAKLLHSLLQQFMEGQELDGPRLDSWHIGEMIERLEKSGQIEKMALAQLEFGLFPAIRHGQEIRAVSLYDGIMSEPMLFSELISMLYKPEHGEREGPVTEATKAAAESAWAIFQACTRQPGTQADGSIQPEMFKRFIVDALEHCRRSDRLTMGQQTLGQIIAHAPPDDDGIWPFFPAREVLDLPDMEEMRRGFSIGTSNKRGVTTRSPLDGGKQERDLATYYRGMAERVQYSQPMVAAMLEGIAKSYELHGRWEDIEANLRKEVF